MKGLQVETTHTDVDVHLVTIRKQSRTLTTQKDAKQSQQQSTTQQQIYKIYRFNELYTGKTVLSTEYKFLQIYDISWLSTHVWRRLYQNVDFEKQAPSMVF